MPGAAPLHRAEQPSHSMPPACSAAGSRLIIISLPHLRERGAERRGNEGMSDDKVESGARLRYSCRMLSWAFPSQELELGACCCRASVRLPAKPGTQVPSQAMHTSTKPIATILPPRCRPRSMPELAVCYVHPKENFSETFDSRIFHDENLKPMQLVTVRVAHVPPPTQTAL